MTVAAPSVQKTWDKSAPTCVQSACEQVLTSLLRQEPERLWKKFMLQSEVQVFRRAVLAFRAEKEAKKGAPVYSLHPPMVPILPACPLYFSAASPTGIRCEEVLNMLYHIWCASREV